MTYLIWILGLLVAATIAFFLVGPERVWQATNGPADMGPMTLETLVRTGKPNDALIGPADALPMTPDANAPVFAVPADELFGQIIAQVEATGTVTWVEQNDAALYARALTFSSLMRFPDTNHIWVLPVDETHATLVLYAAAKLGQSDLGKNRERLDAWLDLLSDVPR